MSPQEVIRQWALVELANLWALVHRWKAAHPPRGQDTFLARDSFTYWMTRMNRS